MLHSTHRASGTRITPLLIFPLLFPAFLLIPGCGNRGDEGTVERISRLLQEDKTAAASQAIGRLHPNDRSRHLPRLLAISVSSALKKARDSVISTDPIVAFTHLNRIFEIPYAGDLLAPLERSHYEQSALSRHLPTEELGHFLGLYLRSYLHFRQTTTEQMPFEERARLSAQIISGFNPQHPHLLAYLHQKAGEHHISRGELRKWQKLLRDSSLTPPDRCDSLVLRIEPGRFSKHSLSSLYAFTLRYSPPSDFQADSISLSAFGRPFSRSNRNLFELWRRRAGPILSLLSSRGDAPDWKSALEELCATPPHSPATLTGSFVHINPVAVAWCADNLVPAPETRLCGVTLKQIYSAIYAPHIRLAALCYLHLANGNILDRETRAYIQESSRGGFNGVTYLRDRFGYLTFAGYPGQEIIPAYTGFWLRRHIDGSISVVWAFLEKILVLYDSEWLIEQTGISRSPDAYEGLHIKALLSDIQRLDSAEGAASRQMERRHLLFSRRLKWRDFLDPLQEHEIRQRIPAIKIGAGSGQSRTARYDQGVLIIEDPNRTVYFLINRFAPARNGLLPGMSRSTVLARLGTPALEKPNFLQYHGDGGPIRLFFVSGVLHCIAIERRH